MTSRSSCSVDSMRRQLMKQAAMGAALSLLPGVLAGVPAMARPAPEFNRPLPPGIVEKGSRFYDFKTHRINSEDGQRHYRITVAIPRHPPPASGYPVLYLLDGNAAMAEIDEALLKVLDTATSPVLVALGYDTDRRFDVVARQWDYTPRRPGQGVVINDRHPERRGGGADDFLNLLEARIMPRTERNLAIDTHSRALWGHSFGGLLTLHALFTRPGLFNHWHAASPTLHWNNHQVIEEAAQWRWPQDRHGSALLMRGDNEFRDRGPYASTAASDDEINDQIDQLARQLDAVPRFSASATIVPDMNHGAMLRESLLMTLAQVSARAEPLS